MNKRYMLYEPTTATYLTKFVNRLTLPFYTLEEVTQELNLSPDTHLVIEVKLIPHHILSKQKKV
jgi:hypothetical protein